MDVHVEDCGMLVRETPKSCTKANPKVRHLFTFFDIYTAISFLTLEVEDYFFRICAQNKLLYAGKTTNNRYF